MIIFENVSYWQSFCVSKLFFSLWSLPKQYQSRSYWKTGNNKEDSWEVHTFEEQWCSHVEYTLSQTESLQALACLPVQVCQPPCIVLKAFPPTGSELARWTSRGSLFPFSQSCCSMVLCCLSTCCSRPEPALGLLKNLGVWGRESPVNGVSIQPGIWTFPTSPALFYWL